MISIFGDESHRHYDIIFTIFFIVSNTACLILEIVAYGMGDFYWILIVILGTTYLIIGLTFIINNQRKLSSKRRINKYDEKTKELYEAIEKKFYNYLKRNRGKAYTSKALVKRIIESIQLPYFKKYVKKNEERILNKMSTNENIQIARKNDEIHYFFLIEE